jgi:hypothetical protein
MTHVSTALADTLRAFSCLQPEDDATRAEIALLLGIEAVDLQVALQPHVLRTVRVDDRARGRDDVQRQDSPLPIRSEASSLVQVEERLERPAILTLDFTANRRPPPWLERVSPLPESDFAVAPAVPLPDSLFAPQWTRALLSAALSTWAEIGPFNNERLVFSVARGIPFQTVPRRLWPTLIRGAQVLVDLSDAMAPFVNDQNGLVKRLRAIVGQQGLEVLRFNGNARLGAGAGPRRTWRPYFDLPTRLGRPVLALTDLGIGERGFSTYPVLPEHWSSFADELNRRGCPLVAFVPYHRDRWPAGLEQVITILPWDRGTSVGTVRRAVGRVLPAP